MKSAHFKFANAVTLDEIPGVLVTVPADQTVALHRLAQASLADRSGNALQAEMLYLRVLPVWPGCVHALRRLAQFAMQRSDTSRAAHFLGLGLVVRPDDVELAIDLAVALMTNDQSDEAMRTLEASLRRTPSAYTAWLLLGQIRDSVNDATGALTAWYQAVSRAQRVGAWLGEDTTPPELLEAVTQAIAQVHDGRRRLLLGALDGVEKEFGRSTLERVHRALSGYLRESECRPTDPRQRPKFLFFPGLPDLPFHDPFLQPWAQRLTDAFADIRREALRVLHEDQRLPNFVEVPAGVRPGHLAGEAASPSWEAFFFYRHGDRFDANHARCPATSALLESIELCRIDSDAPEICFSVLRPGTHILPHHGVTNARLVMHLPLVIPDDCALNLVGAGEHRWQEGHLVMFDDTFQHEAWNRSQSPRTILLMDCWNPHLTDVERLAMKHLFETIAGIRRGNAPADGSEAAA